MKKSIGVLSTTALFLLLGLTVPSYGRQDKPEKQEDKPSAPKQEQPAKPEKQQQEAKAPKQEQPAKPEKQQQEAKASKQEPQAKPEKQQQAKAPKQEPQAKPERQPQQAKGQQEQQQKQQEQAKSTKQQQAPHAQPVSARQSDQKQATSSKGPQRTQEETATQHAQPALRLSSRGSGRIPDERFRSNFGRGHEFRMGNPVIVSGYSRFQYGGYWFGYVQPWPAGWFYTDQFYIDYVDGGYYMYNPYYPGSRFAITVII
jgi:hypothetical protein